MKIYFVPPFGTAVMMRGRFGTVRLAAARPPSACQPSPTGDVEIQGESYQAQIGSQVQKQCS